MSNLSVSEPRHLNRLKSGFTEGIPFPRILNAGSLRMFFDSGSIRQITSGENEVIRMIYSAVRDEYWETIEPEISDETINSYSDSFNITFTCRYKRNEIDFEAFYQISGFPDGTISFEMNGEAKSDFKKNRIGFCVLHPVKEYCGRPVIIEHPDKTQTQSEFPVLISPHQPFKNIRSLKAYFSHSGYSILNFKGDIFETEDQRNWTDGSYKTYCTPLENPKPAIIKTGDKIYQKIDLSVASDLPVEVNKSQLDHIIRISLDPEITFKLPEIGICRTTRTETITDQEIKILREVPFKGYRVEIYFSGDLWKETLADSVSESKALGYPLECSIFLRNGEFESVNDFISIVTGLNYYPYVIYLFGLDCHCLSIKFVNATTEIIKSRFPESKVGCGTNANFAQMNREKPVGANCDFISYSVHPQEHAFDNQSLVENAEAQKYTVESALAFSNGLPVYVSPVTLKRRFNPNKEYFEPQTKDSNVPAQIDMRQSSLFAAGWTLASLKYLAEAGAESITYYETVGERGIIQGNYPPVFPENNYPCAGSVFPVYILFKFLLNLPQTCIVKVHSLRPLEVDVLGLKSNDTLYLLAFNYHDSFKKIDLSDIGSGLEYLIIDVDLYLNKMFQNKWIENMIYKKVPDLNQFELTPYSICIFKSF